MIKLDQGNIIKKWVEHWDIKLLLESEKSLTEVYSTLDSADERIDELKEREISRMQQSQSESIKESLGNMERLRKSKTLYSFQEEKK